MSDGDAMRMGRLLVSQTVKHCSVYVVDGCREGNGVEICSNEKDYVPTEAEYNESGFVEVEVECESEASSEEDRFDDSADDGDHEDHFGFDVEDENDGGVGNTFEGFDGPLNEHDNAQTSGVDAAVNDAAVRDDVEVGEISEGYETEDIDSYEGDSDDMIKKRRYPKYNEAEMSREYVFKVGLEFKSLGQFKDAIREYALLNGRDIRYIKNDKVRCRVGCRGKKGKCRWMAFTSKVGGSDCFRLKTLNGKHTCGRDYSGRLASSSWVSQKIVTNISRGEEMKISIVIQTIHDKYMANILVTKAYWARRKAREEVHGRAILQYGKLRDYFAEIMRTNFGSTTQILVDRPSITHQASEITISRINGCHLKGDHAQQLLVAVGRDPNDNYFLIIVAAVEAETRDSWGWFINLLLEDIGDVSRRKWVFMSDQQKDLILSIAKATYVEEWERRMTQLMNINRQCYEKLASLDPKLWCKSHFTFLAKSDMLMNNISEAFNGRILEARDKPILTMFEWIWCY
ncbi:hypothetical protein Ahy_A07g034348 [Arachis hypogaea]|uniref:Transposase MuDR plant domain-containing protein n=1 Tax=Arachis hypogaea TaxID=3818 RepID=A0A445CBN7_ARAHY|nr:hypothetical protein Ahy_A07g034348 [Arachis hypogaea]